jgi:hypothetical protein
MALRESMNGLIEVLEQQIDHFRGGTKMVQDQFPDAGKLIRASGRKRATIMKEEKGMSELNENNPGPDYAPPRRGERAHPFGAVRRAESCQYRAGRAVLGYRADDRRTSGKVRMGQVGRGKPICGFAAGVSRSRRFFGAEPLVHAPVLSGIQWP